MKGFLLMTLIHHVFRHGDISRVKYGKLAHEPPASSWSRGPAAEPAVPPGGAHGPPQAQDDGLLGPGPRPRGRLPRPPVVGQEDLHEDVQQ